MARSTISLLLPLSLVALSFVSLYLSYIRLIIHVWGLEVHTHTYRHTVQKRGVDKKTHKGSSGISIGRETGLPTVIFPPTDSLLSSSFSFLPTFLCRLFCFLWFGFPSFPRLTQKGREGTYILSLLEEGGIGWVKVLSFRTRFLHIHTNRH